MASRPATQTDLARRNINVRPAEQLEGDGGRHLEESRGCLQLSARQQPVDCGAHIRHRRFERRPANRVTVDAKPLGDVDQMRRRVAARSVSCGSQRPVDHGHDQNPLPFVPATCTARNVCSGWPSSAARACMLPSPNLMPNCSRANSQSKGGRRSVFRSPLMFEQPVRRQPRPAAAEGRWRALASHP